MTNKQCIDKEVLFFSFPAVVSLWLQMCIFSHRIQLPMMHCIHTFVAQNSIYKKKKKRYTIYTYIFIFIYYTVVFRCVLIVGKIFS